MRSLTHSLAVAYRTQETSSRKGTRATKLFTGTLKGTRKSTCGEINRCSIAMAAIDFNMVVGEQLMRTAARGTRQVRKRPEALAAGAHHLLMNLTRYIRPPHVTSAKNNPGGKWPTCQVRLSTRCRASFWPFEFKTTTRETGALE